MRALLGLLVLGSLFVLAATWQRNHTEDLRTQRRQEFGVPDAESSPDDGWSTLVLGAASGADPIPGSDDPAWGDDGGLTFRETDDRSTETERPHYQPDYRYEVQKNDVLGVICQLHYGTAKPSLVAAVAQYNELSSPDAIRAGDVLYLPDRGLLGE